MVHRYDDSNIVINFAVRGRSGPKWSIESQTLPDYDVWLPYAGKGVLITSEKTWQVKPGDCFILRKGETYSAYQDPGSILKSIGVHFDYRPTKQESICPTSLMPFHRLVPNFTFLHELAERAVDAWRRDKPEMRNLRNLSVWGHALLSEIQKIDQQIASQDMNHAQRVAFERLCQEIESQHESLISVVQMAKQLNCSRWKLRRIFIRQLGLTPQAFLAKSRINHAQYLLHHSLLSIKEIAHQLHFTDTSHFCKFFRSHTGLSPSKYREQIGNWPI